MKAFVACSLLALCLLGAYAISGLQENKLLTQQIADYERQNSQLLTQIENNSLQNLEAGRTLRSLQSELSNRASQIAALSRQLETMQQRIDPDYQQIESQIRQQLLREMQAGNSSASPDQRISLLKQLSELDPLEMGEIIAVNAQYGEFIRGLAVSEERKEVIINALQNLISDQNQARSDIIRELQLDPQGANRRDLRRQMQALSSPEAQAEALSYELTESELNAFSEFQEQRQNSFSSFSFIGGEPGAFVNGPVFIENDAIQAGPGQSGAIQMLRAEPSN